MIQFGERKILDVYFINVNIHLALCELMSLSNDVTKLIREKKKTFLPKMLV